MYYFPSTWRRLIAHFADRVYISLLQTPVWIKVGMDYINHDQFRIHWADFVYAVLVGFLYEILSLYFFSTTLGKWQMSLRVITRHKTENNDAVGLDQAILRTLVSNLNFFFGWAIYALAFFKHNRTHLADWVAETQVVSLKERASLPRVRWILAAGFIFLTAGESLQTASITLNSMKWRDPYIYFNSQSTKAFLQDLKYRMEYESDED
tara:strand:- start:6812 stop:7435 length:624 start_codon:yes stop_codon:yes gene_type:complete